MFGGADELVVCIVNCTYNNYRRYKVFILETVSNHHRRYMFYFILFKFEIFHFHFLAVSVERRHDFIFLFYFVTNFIYRNTRLVNGPLLFRHLIFVSFLMLL